MRFSIIYLASLVLVPSLVASMPFFPSPPPSSRPSSPDSPLLPSSPLDSPVSSPRRPPLHPLSPPPSPLLIPNRDARVGPIRRVRIRPAPRPPPYHGGPGSPDHGSGGPTRRAGDGLD
ncbi:hypothetical protein M378DRAFT_27820 [Amanita muscaria Koide BX008]|uniref:Uncharacterized protein n=1 Tax=Amanita muscaria (strain Koide BX008) TaxID=946122 RepID=A0A0C2WNI6_AMAMK|nr:hypothetical protein M378DRAFT_27820 [Amanita muscaria Koide BX008]